MDRLKSAPDTVSDGGVEVLGSKDQELCFCGLDGEGGGGQDDGGDEKREREPRKGEHPGHSGRRRWLEGQGYIN